MNKTVSFSEIFYHPTIEKLAIHLETKTDSAPTTILQSEDQPYYPISFAQERLWVLTNFEEASQAYHMPALFYIKGILQLPKFEEAFRQVIKRHEILRTVFSEREGAPVQIIIPNEEIEFLIEEVIVKKELSFEEINQRVMNMWQSPFDLKKGPMLRCFTLKTEDKDMLSFNMHHMISDGWSVTVLYKEIIDTYKKLLAKEDVPSPDLEIQYKDFVVWQRNELQSEKLEKHREYCNEVFKGEIPLLELPTDFHRPDVKTYNGATNRLKLRPILSQKIHQLAKANSLSLFALLTACINVLLEKYTAQEDIIIGTPVAGRDIQQLEDQIGFYVNTVPLRTKVDTQTTFSTFLQQQNKVIHQALEHQDYPFEMLVEGLDLNRDLSRSALFDVMIVLQNISGLAKDDMRYVSPELELERIPLSNKIAKYDLTFSFTDELEGLELELEYNTDLFKTETIDRLAIHLTQLFERVVDNPDVLIKDLSILDSKEKEFLASKTDASGIAFDKEATIVTLFEAAVAKFPNNIALEVGEKKMTYQELDIKSSQLATVLVREYDVVSEELVLLHFDRREWMIIAILGVLKAGAVYVPVDPSYPVDRINYLIEDSKSRIILYDHLSENDILQSKKNLTCLDITNLNYPKDLVSTIVKPQDLAYVIYTSGTTGKPKGVLIEHGNVTRLLFNESDLFDFNSSDRWSLFHSYCFDFSVWEMYGALLKGGTLVMVPKETAQDSIAFYNFLKNKSITVLNQTPTAFRSLLHHHKSQFTESH